ncbi:trypsin-like serine peptidase [Parabacteroides bouchesdurhonensis]|uniref:trypsin-like serine peptidase n=1 Tax=Parabacteroides bouchesdurhonensis TaxID=1936995 RepID=UPI000C819681|nr:serine protease [Parabacteroides bouchesdurhonensis]
MKKLTYIIIVLFAIGQYITSQVATTFFSNNKALSKVKSLKSGMSTQKVKIFPSVNVIQLLKEDAELEGLDVPFRFGEGFDTNMTLADGEWTDVDSGRLWMMKFKSAGAYSLNFVFRDFYLPEGAELYIANTEGSMLYGPVTSKENINEGTFLTDLVKGDEVTIYLFEPTEKKNLSSLTIARVVHAYKNLFSDSNTRTLGESASCNKDIACYSQYQQDADGVCMILLSSGTEWCSGSLMTTTDQSFKPYILTAFHCIDGTNDRNLNYLEIQNAENWMFKFNYQKSACNGGYVTPSYTFNRATFRAAWSDTDFALMEMNQSPAANISWLGWDRSGNTPSSGFGIHHPRGDVKKIFLSNTALLPNTESCEFNYNEYNSFIMQPYTLWNATFTEGTTEGGSSGFPLFNQNKRVVGQLVGGPVLPICPPVVRRYGRLSQSWTGGGTNDTRLSNWLDPTNTGVTTTDTKVVRATISGPDAICNDELVTYRLSPDIPSSISVNWTVTGGHAFIQSGQGSSTVRVGSTSSFEQGNCTLTATFAGSLPVSKTIHVGAEEVMRIDGPTQVFFWGCFLHLYSVSDN